MLHQRGLWLATVMALALAMPAAAQWKWRDATGRTQYSDLPPPPSVADKDILQRPAAHPPAPAPAAAAQPASAASAIAAAASVPKGVDPELEARRRKAEQEAQAKAKAEADKQAAAQAAAKAENCQRARSHLRLLEDGRRIATVNARGEREFMDDKARAAETKRTREIIAADCAR